MPGGLWSRLPPFCLMGRDASALGQFREWCGGGGRGAGRSTRSSWLVHRSMLHERALGWEASSLGVHKTPRRADLVPTEAAIQCQVSVPLLLCPPDLGIACRRTMHT